MKRAECEIGMVVRDVRDDGLYEVFAERVMATDCGAWCKEVEPDKHGIRDECVIHWSHLEAVTEGEAPEISETENEHPPPSHAPGRRMSCPACRSECHCTPQTATCVCCALESEVEA